MAYTRTTWTADTTPLSAENMNNIEDGIQENAQDISDLSDYAHETLVEKINGYLLYSDESGSFVSDLNLSDLASNYNYMDIYYTVEGVHSFVRVYSPDSKTVSLNLSYWSTSTNNFYIHTAQCSINGRVATISQGGRLNSGDQKTTVWTTKNGSYSPRITRIVGFKNS